MFYPLDPLPAWFRKAALANPITWEIDWLRRTSIGLGSARTVAFEGVTFVLFALVSFALAVRSLQQQEQKLVARPVSGMGHGSYPVPARRGLQSRRHLQRLVEAPAVN